MSSAYNRRTVTATINYAMEFLWLAAALLVPLIVAPSDSMISYIQLPKVALLRTLVSLMVMLWAIEAVLSPQRFRLTPGSIGIAQVRNWLVERPTRIVTAAASAFMAVYLVSTILSTSISVSVWGHSANIDNYGLYNMAIYYTLFLVIATHLQTRAQLWRLLSVIVSVGVISSVVGVLEYLQIIPYGNVSPANPRITSTFGNAIFFAAFLIMTIPITFAFLFKPGIRLEGKSRSALWIALIGVQLLAFMLTLSRGPWVGLAAGLIGFFLFSPLVLNKRTAISTGLILLTALLLAFGTTRALPTPAERNPFDTSLRADDLTLEDRLFSIYGQVSSGGLNNRVAIWEASGRLILRRPWFPNKNMPLSFIRPILGYGPDTYWYVFPLEAIEYTGFQFHAHNHVIHEAVEIGYLGAAAYLALIASVFFSGVLLLKNGRNEQPIVFKLIILMILVAVAARFIEQLVGIARVSDTTLFWLLLGVLTALPNITERGENDSIHESSHIGAPAFLGGASLVRIGIASIIVIALAWTIMYRNVNHVRADLIADRTFETNSLDEAIALTDRASELAPYMPTYYIHGANIVRQVIGDLEKQEKRAALAEKAYVNGVMAAQVDPLSHTARLKQANAALDLGRIGYDGLAQEAVDLYRIIMDSTPQMHLLHSHLWTLIAVAYIESERAAEGVEALSKVDLNNLEADRQARTLYLRGVAENELGFREQAISSLNDSLRIEFEDDFDIKAEAHLLLSKIYSEIGDAASSGEHARLHRSFSVKSDS